VADEHEDDEEQRTEEPSERRLAQAFESGDIALAREFVSLLAFAAGVLAVIALAPAIGRALTFTMSEAIRRLPSTAFADLSPLLAPLLKFSGLILVVVAVVATGLTFLQTRAHLWAEKASPDFERLFSMERLAHFASKAFAQDVLLNVAKLSIVVVVMVWNGREAFADLLGLLQASGAAQVEGLFAPVSKASMQVLLAFAAFAGVDFALTRFRYRKKLMMTREEVKREMKEDEGDPALRGARKRKHRELVKRNAVAETKGADVLIVNPTHIAIAIRYRKTEDAAPKVVAKGKGVLAEAMRDAARSSAIPIVQDIPLARLLYKKVKTGGQVPRDTFKAVAAVLAFVYRLTRQNPASTGASTSAAKL
jgi:flagellar biosynthesis protein FlhB